MTLADGLAQYHDPFVVQGNTDRQLTRLNNAADWSGVVAECPLRYVLRDDLMLLCADLAYSKGSRTLACADLLHIPAPLLWVEWCIGPWQRALQRHGFPLAAEAQQSVGRRGVLIRASRDGRRGTLRTFWNGDAAQSVVASCMEAFFDFDTPAGEEPEPPDTPTGRVGRVTDAARAGEDVLGTCFRFRYERSWEDYYARARLSAEKTEAIWLQSLGTIAIDVPLLLAFVLLLATRSGLPQVAQGHERVNHRRQSIGKPPLLDHIEVRAPILPEYRENGVAPQGAFRRHPRLHRVRGHLVRRGSQIFWRVPHLRGRASAGVIRSRTVIWTFDDAGRQLPRGEQLSKGELC